MPEAIWLNEEQQEKVSRARKKFTDLTGIEPTWGDIVAKACEEYVNGIEPGKIIPCEECFKTKCSDGCKCDCHKVK